jgi:hypothetical protein
MGFEREEVRTVVRLSKVYVTSEYAEDGVKYYKIK